VPLDWAAAQNNLGNALQTLGERESGTARLEEAVAAYRAAEAAIKPSGRDFFVPLDNDPDGPTYDEQIAAFKIEHGGGPHDKVRRIFRIAEGDDPSDLPTCSRRRGSRSLRRPPRRFSSRTPRPPFSSGRC